MKSRRESERQGMQLPSERPELTLDCRGLLAIALLEQGLTVHFSSASQILRILLKV